MLMLVAFVECLCAAHHAVLLWLQLHKQLWPQCLQTAIKQGQRGDWECSLGALRLSRALGCTAKAVSAADAAALRGLEQAAAQDNGTAALIFCEALGRLLPA